MVEAARTTASPTAIWVIVIVAVAVLAFWLTAVMVANRQQVRASGRSPAPDDALTGGSVPGGEGAAQVPEAAGPEPVVPGRPASPEPAPQGDIPTRSDLAAQPGGRQAMPGESAWQPVMPAPRTGDADRAERSHVGPHPAEGDEAGH